MCLIVDIKKTRKEFDKYYNSDGHYYKILVKSPSTGIIHSPWFYQEIEPDTYLDSDRESYGKFDIQDFISYDYSEIKINRGIHVFSSLRKAKKYLNTTFSTKNRAIIVRVWGNGFIAAGKEGDIVFRSVFISKEDLENPVYDSSKLQQPLLTRLYYKFIRNRC